MKRFLVSVLLSAFWLSAHFAYANPDDLFEIYVTPDHAFAKQPGTWRVIIKAQAPVQRATQFKLRFLKGFKDLQNLLPNLAGHVRASTSVSGGRIQINTIRSSYEESLPFWDLNVHDKIVTFTLRDRDMQPGDSIIISIGDGNSQNARSVAHETACRQKIELSVQLAGTSGHVLLSKGPMFDIRPLEVRELYLFAHSVFRPGEQGKLLISTADEHFNIAEDFTGTVVLQGPGRDAAVYPETVIFLPEDKGAKEIPVYFLKEGEYVFTGQVAGRPNLPVRKSNPIRVNDSIPKIFWGDLHSHGAPSRDGIGRGRYYYGRYARGLDFFCATDHADHGKAIYGIIERDWNLQKEEVLRHHKPGEYVCFLGYENSLLAPSGHYNVIFNFKNEDIANVPNLPMRVYPSIQRIWDALDSAGFPALTIPHHCGKIFNFGIEGDDCKNCNTFGGAFMNPKYKRVLEIYSFHGLSESFDPTHNLSYRNRSSISRSADGPFYAQDAWAIGERLGVMASTDDHIGHPGTNPIGITAVLAEELDRDPIFEALQRKACYGTTGERIFLDFRINGHLMGSELQVDPWERPNASVLVLGTDSIDYVELLKWDFKRGVFQNGHPQYEVLAKWEMNPADPNNLNVTFTDLTLADSCLYYVRVKQRNMIKSVLDMKETWAWSSPVWWSHLPYPDSVATDSLLGYQVKAEGKQLVHYWDLANPVYAGSFDIQRRTTNGEWETIHTITPPVANQSSYTFKDFRPVNGSSVYRLVMHLITGQKDTSAIDSATIQLDVLQALTSNLQDTRIARLNWSVANEVYADRYEIYQVNTSPESLVEVVLPVLKPEETLSAYTYLYTLPQPGLFVFKVKMYLEDGTVVESDTASVLWVATSTQIGQQQPEVLQLKTNRLISASAVLEYAVTGLSAPSEWLITDMSGRVIKSQAHAFGDTEWVSVQLQGLAAGAYRFVLRSEGKQWTKPFVLIR